MQKKILIGDDHTIIRTGMKALLETYFGYPGVIAASSLNEIMKELSRAAYTHGFFDIVLTDGTITEILPNIRSLYPDMKICLYSMQPSEVYRQAVKQFGVDYYVSKTSLEDELKTIFSKFLNDEPYPEQAQEMLSGVPDNPFSSLTARELDVLHYLLKGMTPSEIGKALNLQRTTVQTLKDRIFKKTETSNIKELNDLAVLYNVS